MDQYAVSVWVNGTPKGQPRPRASSYYNPKKGKYMARVFDCGSAENWKAQVQLALADHIPEEPLLGPFAVVMSFALPRPKSLQRKKDPDGVIEHVKKPDADNLAKAVMDAINNLEIWHDDSQVSALTVTKFYTSKDGRPGLALDIVQLEPAEIAECAVLEAIAK